MKRVLVDSVHLKFCFSLTDLENSINQLFYESGILDHFLNSYSNLSSSMLLANELDRCIDFLKCQFIDGKFKSSTTLKEVVDDLTYYVTNRTIELHRYTNGGPMYIVFNESSKLDDIVIQDYVTLMTYYFNISGIADYLANNSQTDEEVYEKIQEVVNDFQAFVKEFDVNCDIAMVDIYAESWFKDYYRRYCWR